MKKLIYSTIIAIITFSASIPAAYGNPTTVTRNSPYITGSVVFPKRSKTPSIDNIVRHSFRLQVPSQSSALSQVIINVPEGLKMPKSVKVSDASNQAVNADVAMNDRLITVTFPQPVVSGTLLAISMDNVRVAGRSNGWLYPVSAKLVGLSSYIPVGFARFSIGY